MTFRSQTINISRRLDAAGVAEFKENALALLGDSEKIILNFSNTVFIDSAGLGALVSLLKAATQANKKIVLVALTPQVQQIFELTKLYRIFEICDTVKQAEAQ